MTPSVIVPGEAEVTPVVDVKASLLAQPVTSNYVVDEEPIHSRRPLRIVCMGAGYSGLMMGIVYSEKLQAQNCEFIIYERNEDLGGTWFENR
jgi:hypothetical protein